MEYYSERNGLRTPVNKTYDITLDMYALIYDCCDKYVNNMAWKYPDDCPDGYGCCGTDYKKLNTALKFEIPNLYRSDSGYICCPNERHYGFGEQPQFDQYALLDYVEFIAQNIRDIKNNDYHTFFRHYHLSLETTDKVFYEFQKEMNEIFTITGLLYQLTDKKIIERIIENSPLSPKIEAEISCISEIGTKELLEEAIRRYKDPNPQSRVYATEKIWDAFERLKTYYTTMKKNMSADKIVNDIANHQEAFIMLFNDEFEALTKIGNRFRIRHHETDKIDITDSRHYDYFFNRCLSLIALAIQYLR